MQLLTGIRWRMRRLGRDQIAERAARVLDKAMFDIGIDNLLNGTVMLDEHFRPRFFSSSAACARPGVATVVLSQLDEACALQALARSFDTGTQEHKDRSAALLSGVIREFHVQSPAFRALR
ncbi:MAG: hypothetical protein M3Y65_11865 [Pseudomonadota bacterium]|nr:hypothetical protein [Pseudomonadota bacterium]